MNDIDKLTAKSLHWNFKLFMMQMFVILFSLKYLCILSSFSQECFEILTRSTKVLREEYLDRHEKARREIERRCASLEAKKSQQHMTLVKLTQVCLSLTSNFFVKLKYISFYYISSTVCLQFL